MSLRASLIITASDRASSAFERIGGRAKAMLDRLKGVNREGGVAGRAMERLGTRAGESLRRIGAGAARAAGRAGIGAITIAAKAAAVGLTGLAGGLAFLAGKGLAGVITVGSQFEQFQAQLEGTEGSAIKAKAALDWAMKFATQTPYEVDQVTDAFVRARGVGIDPFTGALRSMGDAASANRKTLLDAVEAVADAQTFEFERLKEFNITSSTKGGQVSFSFIGKDGVAAVKTVKKDAMSIQKAILEIWDARHAGAMIRQSKTFAGLWSNIKDAATMFLYRMSQTKGGIFEGIKNTMASALETLNKWNDDGTLKRWADEASIKLREMWEWGKKFVNETDWRGVGSNIGAVARAAATLFGWIAKMVRAAERFGEIWDSIPGLRGNAGIIRHEARMNEARKIREQGQFVPGALDQIMQRGQFSPKNKAAKPLAVGGEINLNISAAPGIRIGVSGMTSRNQDVPVRVNRGAVGLG